MRGVFDKGKSAVFVLIGGGGVDNDIFDVFGDLAHFGEDLFLFARLWNATHEQTAVVDRRANAQRASLPNLVIVELGDRLPCVRLFRVGYKAEAAIASVKVHHQAQLVNGANLLEDGEDFVFEEVARDLSHKHFASLGRHFPGVIWRWTKFALSVLLNLKIKNIFFLKRPIIYP